MLRPTYKRVVNKQVDKSLVCFCYISDSRNSAKIQACINDLNSTIPDDYIEALKKLMPEYGFELYFNLREYHEFYENLKGRFLSVYGLYVDSNTKLWGVGSEEQDSFMEATLESMYPFLPKGSYTRALSLQPATYSSVIRVITNYSLIRN